MNIVRCTHCGEVADYDKRQTCRGCGEPLSTAGKRPRKVPAVQREASGDLTLAKGILIALAIVAFLGAALYFGRDFNFMGAFLGIGLAVAFLTPILRWIKRREAATPEDPGPKGANRPELEADPSTAQPEQSFGSAVEQGCGMVLKIVGIFIAVVGGLAVLGFLVLWIACMGTSWGHF